MVSSVNVEWNQCVWCLHVTILLNYDSEKRHLCWFTSSINKFLPLSLPPYYRCPLALIPCPEKTFDFVLQNVHAAIRDDFSCRGAQSTFYFPPSPVMLIPSEWAFIHMSVLWAGLLVGDNPTLVFVRGRRLCEPCSFTVRTEALAVLCAVFEANIKMLVPLQCWPAAC